MAGNEYAVSTGGSLKLKGISNSGVKKKKRNKKQQHGKSEHPAAAEASHDTASAAKPHAVSAEEAAATGKQSTSPPRILDDDDDEQSAYVGKTEAEIRHEQMRKKRLNDRIKREGVQTHKERVEGLNRYLSALSEHHDMPRIGPG